MLCRPRLLWALGSLAMLAGCSPAADVLLVQRQYQGRERELHLTSEEARWSPGDGVDRVLAEFALPGARTGRPVYLLYLRMPHPSSGRSAVDRPIRGFLIQTRGRNAGLELVVGGEVTMADSLAGAQQREFTFEIMCENQTRLAGRLAAKRDDGYVTYFETRRRPGDVDPLVAQERTDSESAQAPPDPGRGG